MILSARNLLKGRITQITSGPVNSEVIFELPDGIEMVSVVTRASVENLRITEGKEVYAVIKSSSVMLAVD